MERPDFAPGTSEIGSLTAHSNEDSQFVGSSSGIYFINTVKRAFSNGLDDAGSQETEFPNAESTLVGAEDSCRNKRQRMDSGSALGSSPGGEPLTPWKYDPAIASSLGAAPSATIAKELMVPYFKIWHSLFPFLHGPTFLDALDKLYSSASTEEHQSGDSTSDHRSTCWTVIFQCVFNLGSLLRPDLGLPSESKIKSPRDMNNLLSTLAHRHDVVSLQAMLAIQVYLVATMSLRLASTFGGCIIRSMLHAGLHRCPFRYSQLSSHDRQLRKRIFWCAYAIDRYLSQALGLPLGVQDSDIDVCLPLSPEVHSPRLIQNLSTYSSTPNDQTGTAFRSSSLPDTPERDSEATELQKKEIIIASYVNSGTLTGRALELFHKSILVRSVRRNSVLFLVTDVHKWWNSLPLDLQGKGHRPGKEENSDQAETPFDFGPFFTVLYQHLILIIHRPSLSLDPSSAEFCSGLQTCIGAAREIIAALKSQVHNQQPLFWPGFLSAAWMSGLVLAFACQLKQYVLMKGLQEIDECSSFLLRMSSQWETAKQCHQALLLLSSKVRRDQHNMSNPHAYALRTPDREAASSEQDELREQNKYYQTNASPYDAFVPEPRPEINPMPARYNEGNTHSTVTEELDFQSAEAGYLAGGSSFDLNMVDLLDGANFDSLFDLIGQQYPSF
ncbi:hypothetical protein N7456_003125 [Penicillium angulare]|uniref:Xylanolytic transcriptional activator regulatory domain-containing protein n=1 Tax=Penicillium angulare TaxID=116970 RepID=A0A9W9FU35_9EURO|nr:hypothetical protein N7456_003125 [Penicillium angulare]